MKKYHIKEINRTVNLDDDIVNIYSKMCELHDALFLLEIHYEYENTPIEDITDEELSLTCNRAMITELKGAMLIPKTLTYIKDHLDILDDKSHEG